MLDLLPCAFDPEMRDGFDWHGLDGKIREGGLEGGEKQEETYVRTYCIVLLCSFFCVDGCAWLFSFF